MKKKPHSVKNLSNQRQAQYKKDLIDYIVRIIEKKTGSTLQELKRANNQKELYRIGLYNFVTTNKAICEALQIPVEAGTRRKRDLEKEGRLKSTNKKGICHYTKHPAHYLTTNPKLYHRLK